MYKLGLGKAKEPRSNCQHFLGHRESNGIQENIYLCLIDYTKAFDSVDHNKLWKTLKEMRIPDNPTYLLKNLHGTTNWLRKQELELCMEQVNSSGLGKEYVKSVYCHSIYLSYMQRIS